MRGVNILDNIARDARFAVRQLLKRPAFTVTAIMTLSLGLCASIAIFAFVDAALIRPLPYQDPSKLVGVFERSPQVARSNLSYLDYLDWKRLNRVFSTLSAYQGGGIALQTADGLQRTPSARVSDDFFQTLGVTPALGRAFRKGEDLPDAPRLVILSYGAWQARYGAQNDVLGRTVTLDGEPRVIVGVLPRDFHFAPVGAAEFWLPLHASNPCDKRRSCHNLYGVARLAEGVSVSAAGANMVSIAADLERQYPDSNRQPRSSIWRRSSSATSGRS